MEQMNKPLTEYRKVTDMLIECSRRACKREPYDEVLSTLKHRHEKTIDDLFPVHGAGSLQVEVNELNKTLHEQLDRDLADVGHILRSLWLSKDHAADQWWYGYGELWSTRTLAAFLQYKYNLRRQSVPNYPASQPVWVDARDVLSLKEPVHNSSALPDLVASRLRLQKWLHRAENQTAPIMVVTGYVVSDHNGRPCTLGRDGSDYSSSIFAALLKADYATIWTDVDGVYSANPTVVQGAVIRDRLSYDEASELAYFGAKVIHPKTMTPLVLHDIPVWLRNSFRPHVPGTCIMSRARLAAQAEVEAEEAVEEGEEPMPQVERLATDSFGVKGFSTIDDLATIQVEGTGMIGVTGFASRLFGAVGKADCNVVLITQAGSEHSICFALPDSQGDAGLAAVHKEFRYEIENGEIQTASLTRNLSCLAAVGDGMSGMKGLAGRMMTALGAAGINIIAIAQGSSEINLSIMISGADAKRALRVVHTAFVSDPRSQIISPLSSPRERAMSQASAAMESVVLEVAGRSAGMNGSREKSQTRSGSLGRRPSFGRTRSYSGASRTGRTNSQAELSAQSVIRGAKLASRLKLLPIGAILAQLKQEGQTISHVECLLPCELSRCLLQGAKPGASQQAAASHGRGRDCSCRSSPSVACSSCCSCFKDTSPLKTSMAEAIDILAHVARLAGLQVASYEVSQLDTVAPELLCDATVSAQAAKLSNEEGVLLLTGGFTLVNPEPWVGLRRYPRTHPFARCEPGTVALQLEVEGQEEPIRLQAPALQ